ncbi:hypothetical protein SDC9_192494 [bioreactor metagenome]|uniref:Uncharacterized protein n=1 Tax=bioreactor metagenome TaxID=1076179 RepID=A0A645I0X3_9ZZZZ
MLVFGKFHPARAAAGKERQVFPLGQAVHKLGAFLNDRHVRSKGGIIDFIDAHDL